ncbi:hypothetical protein F5I97DRAFT_176458 [Phlebopus sp. FC_14]|nr:hypothetical protein F5I97DRAFT_176458 [Phlebopus sp. FC_14]
MITPSHKASSLEQPLPSTLPPLAVSPPSLGSKFAAHFTPLRSPSKNLKSHHTTSQKPIASPATLSPPVNDDRAPSFESSRPSMQSRSTTPRPLHHAPVTGEGDDEDFSDLFTLPQVKKAASLAKNTSYPIVSTINTMVGPTPKKIAEDGPPSPTPPSSPCLQFPIPPSTIRRAPIAVSERPRHSVESCMQEVVSASSRSHVHLPKAPPSPRVATDAENSQITSDEQRPRDERIGNRNRVASHSGSDTDASRTSPRSSNFRPTMLPKVSTLKPPLLQSPPTKNPSGPPPSTPLPSPPLSASGSMGSINSSLPAVPSVNSVTSNSCRLSGPSPRPRANTLSVASAHNAGRSPALKHNSSSAPQISSQDVKADTGLMPDASADQIREALALQRRKYAQLQEYIVTITKRYKDDRVALTKTIEKLERDIRKKTREIEGLRWLVVHNGGVGDIDAAAHLARSSLSMQDDDLERARPSPSSVKRSQTLTESLASSSGAQSVSGRKGLGINFHHDRQSSSTLEIPSDYTVSSATSSQSSLSLQAVTLPTTSLSAIPEQPFITADISRADRQRAKEERRAARALRRISASSVSALSSGTEVTTELSTPDQSFGPKQGMDEVLEKLRPFANI